VIHSLRRVPIPEHSRALVRKSCSAVTALSLPPPPSLALRRLALPFPAQVRVLALTDHDTFGGVEEAQRAGLEAGVAIVPGVEISTFLVGARGSQGTCLPCCCTQVVRAYADAIPHLFSGAYDDMVL